MIFRTILSAPSRKECPFFEKSENSPILSFIIHVFFCRVKRKAKKCHITGKIRGKQASKAVPTGKNDVRIPFRVIRRMRLSFRASAAGGRLFQACRRTEAHAGGAPAARIFPFPSACSEPACLSPLLPGGTPPFPGNIRPENACRRHQSNPEAARPMPYRLLLPRRPPDLAASRLPHRKRFRSSRGAPNGGALRKYPKNRLSLPLDRLCRLCYDIINMMDSDVAPCLFCGRVPAPKPSISCSDFEIPAGNTAKDRFIPVSAPMRFSADPAESIRGACRTGFRFPSKSCPSRSKRRAS